MDNLKYLNKQFPQNCGDIFVVENILKENNRIYFQGYFQKYYFKGKFLKDSILKGSSLNPQIEVEEFINKIWHQNCGDDLKIIQKSKEKLGYFECEFIKYSYKILALKSDIKKGTINNPQIEVVEFINKIWHQNCGDDLKIIKKLPNEKGKNSLFECEFLKYPYKINALKQEIVKGAVINPQIEVEEFINKIWHQNCGDSLKILEKTNKTTSINNHHKLWKCEFIKYPCIIYAEKNNIIKGTCLNPKIEEQEFIGKEFKQNCGDILRVIEKTNKKNNSGNVLYKCQFLNFPNELYLLKAEIIKGNVDNPFLPWKDEENFKQYILGNFEEKPTLQELANNLNLAYSHICNLINRYNLKDLIYYPSISSQEKYIKDFVNQYYIANSDTSVLNGQEIDIYVKDLKFGIEFNGNLWHSSSEKFGVSNNYHQEKSLLAQEKGIFLLHIFEYEWREKQNICEALIKSKLGIFDKKIGARKCVVKELDNKTYQNFCNKNHLQGEAGAKVKLGLYFKEELVQIMSFSLPRFTDKYQWEIIRECSKLGYFILGGKEKLWKYFIKKYNPNNCISYCDFSKFSGGSYLKLGFKKERLNKPGFVWWDENKNEVYWRSPQNHKEMKNKYLQIFDCGQLVFVWN